MNPESDCAFLVMVCISDSVFTVVTQSQIQRFGYGLENLSTWIRAVSIDADPHPKDQLQPDPNRSGPRKSMCDVTRIDPIREGQTFARTRTHGSPFYGDPRVRILPVSGTDSSLPDTRSHKFSLHCSRHSHSRFSERFVMIKSLQFAFLIHV